MSCSLRNLPLQLLAFFLLGSIATAATALDITNYIPHAAGNQWSYINNNSATETVTIGSPVVLPSGVTAFPATIVNSSETGYTNTYTTIDGNGLRRHQEFLSSVFVTGYGNTSVTATYSPALIFAPINATVGSTYTFSGAGSFNYTNVGTTTLSYSTSTQIIGFETVTNYNGTQSWSAVKVIFSVTFSGTVNGQFISNTSSSTSWFVDGIGTVQMYKPNKSGVMETWKLTSTNVAPPKVSQTIGAISFSPTTLTVGGATTASATATSGLAVSFSSMTPGVCTVSGSTVTGVAVGTCTIAADQTGNAGYNAATQVTQSISVSAAAAPAVSLSPTSLTFTNQSVGVTSAAQTAILTNSGTVALNITGIAASGDFAQTNNCGASIAAGASCTLTITSTPTVAGVRNGTVTITSDAASSPSVISVASLPPGTLSFVSGWNLAGNSVNAPLTVATTFGNAANISTVWKWIPATSKWAFYTPTLTDGGSAYAAIKGYDFLTTINGGEGFWVNAKAAFTAQLPAGAAVTTAHFQDALIPPNPLSAGWNLISVGDNPTPVTFNNGIGLVPPTVGTIAINLTTLWAWDSVKSNWYFYAPSLDANGTLGSYIITKNYLNFGAKVLDPTMGFWVNHP